MKCVTKLTKRVRELKKRLWNNYMTKQKTRVKNTVYVNTKQLEKILEAIREKLKPKETCRARANLNGVAVQFITNIKHQFEFWSENWWLANQDIKPSVFLYSINEVQAEPTVYYCKEKHTSIFLNFDYYGQCKSRGALGPSSAILEEEFHTHSIHGACAEIGGKGVVIVAPTGIGKTTQAFKLFLHPEGKIMGDDWVYISYPENGGNPNSHLIGTQPEKSLYMRTENEKDHPWLRPILDTYKCENVVTRKEDCENPICLDSCARGQRKCVFDEGKKWCYYAFGNSRAMVPREALKGNEKVVDKIRVDLVVLLRRDRESPAEVKLKPDEAIEVLRKGEFMVQPGAGPKEMWGKMSNEPWYNPYPYSVDLAPKIQEYYFTQLFSKHEVPCVLLNTGVETVEQTHRRIIDALKA